MLFKRRKPRPRRIKKPVRKSKQVQDEDEFKLQPELKSVRGMNDILPMDWKYWDFVEKKVKTQAEEYGFRRIETPILEKTSLFQRGIGEATEVIEKEMYSFTTKSGDKVSLRPEDTAGIMRAYLEHGMKTWSQPVRLWYLGAKFRHERPQAGRTRQFWQYGFEIIGAIDPMLDAHVIQIAYSLLERLHLKGLKVQVNSIGCPSCREPYMEQLKDYYEVRQNKLCKACRERLASGNLLRLLDCKEEKCQQLTGQAPLSLDQLCDDCHDHFKKVLEYLDELELPYELNPRLVRGLDYYTKTVFEIWPAGTEEEGSPSALLGGGRYDGLIEQLGGEPTPGLGFAGGIERTINEIKSQGVSVPDRPKPDLFLIQLGEMGKQKSLRVFQDLRKSGLRVAEAFGKDSIKAQLKSADKKGARIALILGQKEAIDDTIIFRDMESGVQEIVDLSKVVKEAKKRVTKLRKRTTKKVFRIIRKK